MTKGLINILPDAIKLFLLSPNEEKQYFEM